MKICGLYPSTLHPPALSTADDDATAAAQAMKLPYVLLEVKAYVANRGDNATTASSTTCDGKRVQVTLCRRRPPFVSYVAVHSPDAAEINMEPTILAAEAEFILLRLIVGAKGHAVRNIDYYVYQAAAAAGAAAEDQAAPSLTLLPRPPAGYNFDAAKIGILGYHNPDGGRREYILAGVSEACWWRPAGQFDLCLYDSKLQQWRTLEASLSPQELKRHGGDEFYHKNCKVVAVGGDAGTMAFVDLWRGIVFCDVLLPAKDKDDNDIIPPLHYVRLPRPLQRNKTLEGDARVYRNIAVVGDRIKYVELQVHYKASVLFEGQFIRNGWMAATWSRPANRFSSEGWQRHNRVMDSKDLKVDNNERYFELLPKVQNDEGTILAPFIGLDVCQPVLSLGDDGMDVIYFTAKRNRGDADGWVVSVDLEKKELVGVASFVSDRYIGINFAYMHSRISQHL